MPSRDDSAGAALAAATAELYAVAPDEFIATRTRLVQEAKAAGDAALAKEISGLRRPTVAAWVVNRAVRERPEEVRRLEDVGERMRAAQAQLDAARLRDLRSEREELVAGFVAAAAEVAEAAGRPLGPAALEEVRGTVVAALASDGATAAVASGHLTRALSYSGFGEVDLSEAVARTSSGAVLTVVAPRQESRKQKPDQQPDQQPQEERNRQGERERAQLERVREVEEAHAAAAAEAEEAVLALGQARDRADEARWRVEELESELQRARKEQHAAEQAATAAARARRTAEAAAGVAARRLQRVRAESGSVD